MSLDGSAMQFLMGAPTMSCNPMELKTEHKYIFLTREHDIKIF